MDGAIALFDDITVLDAVGPYEVLWQLPDARVRFVATELGVTATTAAPPPARGARPRRGKAAGCHRRPGRNVRGRPWTRRRSSTGCAKATGTRPG